MTAQKEPAPAMTQKVYRFALYGRQRSGKTCILAALAMERIAHPEGISCLWIEKPTGTGCSLPVKQSSDGDDHDAAFTHGREWLKKAIRNLEQGVVPPPNPNDTNAFRFLYEFTAADHRTFLVELIDYSGELIDPDLSETELASKLRHHMLSMDGILVLAEAPHRGQPIGELYKELQRLKRAFSALRGEKQDGPALNVPVALLINKWDRRVHPDGLRSETSGQGIQEFLTSQPEPPHRGLVDVLRGSVMEDLFKVFPVSAFGKTLPSDAATQGDRDGLVLAEKPAQVNPLCSFGLDDGFVWISRCRDHIDINELEKLSDKRNFWKSWQLLDLKVVGSLTDRARHLSLRFHQASEEQRRIHKAARRVRIAFGCQIGVVCLILATIYLGTGVVTDYLNFRTHRPTLANLHAANTKQVKDAEAWLEVYGKNRWFFHAGYRLLFNGETAAKQLVAIREQKKSDALLKWSRRWYEVDSAPDEVTQEGLARKLRDDLQASTETDESVLAKCDSVLQRAESNRLIRENVTALQTVEAEFNNLLSSKSDDREEYRRVRRRVEDLPMNKASETQELSGQRFDLARKIDLHLDGIERFGVDRKNITNEAFISEHARRLEAGGDVPDLELIIKAVQRGIPFPEVATADIQQRYSSLCLKAQSNLDDAIRLKERLKFEDEYHSLVRGGNLREAAQRVVEKGTGISGTEALKLDFRKRSLPRMALN